jgi:serine incorporator 1/3
VAFHEEGNRGFCIGLGFFTFLFYGVTIAGVVCLYIFFGGNPSCHLNRFFITFNLLLCIIVSVVSILPKVQEHLSYSGLLQSSLVSLYVMYLTWAAMINTPYPECNANLVISNVSVTTSNTNTQMPVRQTATLQFDWHIIVGLIIFYIVAMYSSIRSNAHTQAGQLTISGTENTQLADQSSAPGESDDVEGQQVWDNEKDGVAYDYSLFHAICLLGALYIQMTLTNWYSPSSGDMTVLDPNSPSIWVKIVSSWLCLGLYLWTMIAPLIFPDRVFE